MNISPPMGLCELRIPAPKARNVKAWAIGPGKNRGRCQALKARNAKEALHIALLIFRAFSASKTR